MQTFLPYSDFVKCAKVLDWRRLGKQRVEAFQIHNVLVENTKKKGWKNHPAVLMWKGYERYLAGYHNIIIKEWIARKYKNNMLLIRPAIYEAPPWVTKRLIISHRSNLLRKDYDWYSQFGWNVSDDLEYYWPVRKDTK